MTARDNRYFGALVLVAAIIPLPFLAALITIIAYLSPSPLPAVALIILGLIITLVLWLLLAIPCMRFATAKDARPSDYEGLKGEVKALEIRLKVVKEKDEPTQDNALEHKKARDIVISDVEAAVADINTRLNSQGLHWLSTGYVNLWDRINKANEAIIDVLPCETVIESVNYEELRLNNSEVPESKGLLTLLKNASTTLSSDPNRTKQSSEQNQDTNLQHSLAQAMLALLKKAADPPSLSAANNGQGSQQSEQEARADIRMVKAALHKFTNERWDGLVRARNQLMVTAFLTAFFTYILVIIAILAHVPAMNTLDAMVFYFLGAIVGLFGRLFDERNADTVIDDYGLSMARIIVTPLISGLAALVGVLFVTSSSIDTIYKISLQNLVFASVLGFAPNLLISMLRSKSEDIKGQIKSASPSDQKSGKSSSGSSKGNSSGDSG